MPSETNSLGAAWTNAKTRPFTNLSTRVTKSSIFLVNECNGQRISPEVILMGMKLELFLVFCLESQWHCDKLKSCLVGGHRGRLSQGRTWLTQQSSHLVFKQHSMLLWLRAATNYDSLIISYPADYFQNELINCSPVLFQSWSLQSPLPCMFQIFPGSNTPDSNNHLFNGHAKCIYQSGSISQTISPQLRNGLPVRMRTEIRVGPWDQ